MSIQPKLPKRQVPLIVEMEWRIECARGAAKAVRKANRSFKVPKKLASRHLRDVYDHEFLRGCQYMLGLDKGSLNSCLGALYWGKDCAEDLRRAILRRPKGRSSGHHDSRAAEGKLCGRITVEHVVPVEQVRRHYFPVRDGDVPNEIPDTDFVAAALCPVAVITKKGEKKLKLAKSASDSTWPTWPFERYVGKSAEIVTFDGKRVSPRKWSWRDHWKLVNRAEPLKALLDKFNLSFSDTRWNSS